MFFRASDMWGSDETRDEERSKRDGSLQAGMSAVGCRETKGKLKNDLRVSSNERIEVGKGWRCRS